MYLIFFGFFAAEGIIYPFWPTWLNSLGFSASQIGLLIAAVYWPQVMTGVLITYVADWRVDQLRLAAILGFSAALCTLLFYFMPVHLWGEPVDVEVSGIAADALGARRIGAIAWQVTQRWVKESLLLADDEIRAAQLALWKDFHLAVEPAAALGLAALKREPRAFGERP